MELTIEREIKEHRKFAPENGFINDIFKHLRKLRMKMTEPSTKVDDVLVCSKSWTCLQGEPFHNHIHQH